VDQEQKPRAHECDAGKCSRKFACIVLFEVRLDVGVGAGLIGF